MSFPTRSVFLEFSLAVDLDLMTIAEKGWMTIAEKGFGAKDRGRFPLGLRVREETRAGNEASDHLRETTKDVREVFR
jgi:hypothetical protein